MAHAVRLAPHALVRVLLDDPLHREQVKLPPDDWTALVTWVDANAPYFDAFVNKRPPGGGPPRGEIRPRFEPLAAADVRRVESIRSGMPDL